MTPAIRGSPPDAGVQSGPPFRTTWASARRRPRSQCPLRWPCGTVLASLPLVGVLNKYKVGMLVAARACRFHSECPRQLLITTVLPSAWSYLAPLNWYSSMAWLPGRSPGRVARERLRAMAGSIEACSGRATHKDRE
jgi:hypothetical protein